MSNTDDSYAEFSCTGHMPGNLHMNVLYAESGNLLLGIARCMAFVVFLGLQSYNRILLRRKQQNQLSVIRGLILPSYLPFLWCYSLFSIASGVADLLIQSYAHNRRDADSWLYPISMGISHIMLEGLAFFLTRYGAGMRAISRSLQMSTWWGLLTALYFMVIFAAMDGGRFKNLGTDTKDLAYALFAAYETALLLFYTLYSFVPPKYLHHRPALTFYARFQVLTYIAVLVFVSLYHADFSSVVCPGSAVAFIFQALLQPLAIYKTLLIDSQYWQGLGPEAGNPLTETWDSLEMGTAATLAENLEAFDRSKLPILHFGLIQFDTDLKYVPGGFSRVYFGQVRRERVALKTLFAIELNAEAIREFYAEASVLYQLRHPNVVRCIGVCVMPPALTLEWCRHGSLFDFLYKPEARTNR
eukprot:CAMPEP_0173174692 /NCGR_PEP_ID=MMETSP1141-20130122/3490_1 /TAXON_ID=483371 /ORGANISM="non described non described, Strain CCMP2298" /LENGTH=413 /DNA_ID=CAMNT_0014096837 /DNA_START=99 /DNA_END=1337 /DNA_ORIENTATION=-